MAHCGALRAKLLDEMTGYIVYCVKCGAKMPEGTRFCTACGARMTGDSSGASSGAPAVSPDGVTSVAPPSEAPTRVIEALHPVAQRPEDTCPQPVAGRSSSVPRRGRGAAVALAVGVGALAGVGIAAALTSGFGLLKAGGDGQVSATTVAQRAEAEQAPSEVDVDAEQEPAPSTIELSLENAADREAIGTFVSNFTEVGQGITAQSHYERTDSPDQQTVTDMVLYLEYHMMGNANDHVSAVDADDPLAAEGYAYRVDATYLIDRIARQFDVTVSADQLPYTISDGNKGAVEGNWFYFATSVEGWQSMGVPYTTSLTDIGDNRYEVTFDVYRPADGVKPVDVLLRVYGWPLADMLDAVGASDTPIYSATATIEAYLNDDGDVTFHLLRMN